ncbi:MAG: acetyl-CoA carboxylase biotin carboxyl carrier protein subunit [Bacteroidota bacterium]
MSRNDILFEKSELEENGSSNHSASANNLLSPIPGKIFKINVNEGDKVKKGEVVIVVDAMKMENNLIAKKDSIVKKIHVTLHQMVAGNYLLVELEDIKE